MRTIKRSLCMILAMIMVLSTCGAVVFGAERVYLYKQDFEHFATGIHHNDGGMYDYGIAGDSYITATIHEDERGKYLQASPQNANEPARITMWQGDEGFASSPDASGIWVMNQDFVTEVKIKPASGDTTFTVGPTSVVKADWKKGDNFKLATLTANETVSIYKNGTAEATEYTTASEEWYDVLIYTIYDASSPKFSLYMKKEAEEEYTCVAENVDYPSGNYSQGISIFGFMLVKGLSSAYVDEIVMYYPEVGYEIPGIDNMEKPETIPPSVKNVEILGNGEVGTSITGDYDYEGFPAQGNSQYRWLISDTEKDGYKPIENENKIKLSLKEEWANKYIEFEVTPVNTEGEDGEPVTSEPIQVVAVEEEELLMGEPVYQVNYNDTEIPEGETMISYQPNASGSSWYQNCAGSYAIAWLLNDENSKDGNYFVMSPQADVLQLLLGDHLGGHKNSFVYDMSFNSLSVKPNGTTNSTPAQFTVNIFPYASVSTNGREGEGPIVYVNVGESISVVNDTVTQKVSFVPQMDTWYDLRVITDVSTAVPTYDLLIKPSEDSRYFTLAENVSFPKTGDYSQGLGFFSIATLKPVNNNTALAVDDIKMSYYGQHIAPVASDISVSGSGNVGTTLYGNYSFTGVPAEGKSEYEWLVSDTEKGTYKALENQNLKSLPVTSDLKGKYVKFRVTPVNKDEEKGKAIESSPIKVIETEKEYGIDNLNNVQGDLTVAFLGGSNAYGIGASKPENRYANLLISGFLKTKYSNKTITVLNRAIDSASSETGLMQVNREIAAFSPDVVFLDFSSEDSKLNKATVQRNYEGIVRQLLSMDKQPVVIPLFADATGAQYQKEVADHYGLGSIDLTSVLSNVENAYTDDKLNDTGHRLCKETIEEAWRKNFNQYCKASELPKEIISDHEFVKTQLVPLNEEGRIEYEGDFAFDAADSFQDAVSGYSHWGNGSATSKTVGDIITFTFKGESLGLWAMKGPEYGKVSYTIDGDIKGEIDFNGTEKAPCSVLKTGLSDGKHTVVIENKGGGTENLFTYGYFFTENDDELNPNPENVTISGDLKIGKTVSAEFDGSAEEVSYRWLYADSEDGEFKPISKATKKEWKVTTSYLGKYIRVEVKADKGNTSLSPVVAMPTTNETVLLYQGFEKFEVGKNPPSGTFSSWYYNFMGSYADTYVMNDEYSINGNYGMYRSDNTEEMRVGTHSAEYGEQIDGIPLVMKNDFRAEFSFNNFIKRDEESIITPGDGVADMLICMWSASMATDHRDDKARDVGKLVHIVPGESISVINNGVEEPLDAAYVPARGEWYDIRIDTDMDNENGTTPTFDVYLKKHAEKEYTLIAEKVSYPSDYNYNGGIATWAFIVSKQENGFLGFDNIKFSYPASAPVVPSADKLMVTCDKMATDEEITASYEFIDANGDEEDFDASEFVWYRGNTADGDDFKVIEGATSNTYILTKADENKYLKFAVKPKSMVEPVGDEWFAMEKGIAGPFAPTADNIRLKEGAIVGRTVQAEFDYVDLNGDNPGAHKYQWYVADSATGEPEKITGETKDSIKIEASYKYLFLEVTPVSEEKPYEGKTTMSDAFAVSSDNSAPVASDVKIEGNNVVGVPVTGVFKFADPDGDSKGECLYRWYICDTEEGDYAPIENQETDTLYLNETYQNRYIKFGVTPVDFAGMQGDEVLSEAVFIEGKLPNELFVSLDGNDENYGTLKSPFRTLEAARDAIRKMKQEGSLPAGGMTVYVRGGEYKLEKGFNLTAEDSGTEECPIVYRNYHDEKVILSGKQDIDFSKFGAITDETMKNKLRSADARSKVVVADLADIGLEDFKEIEKTSAMSGTNAPMIFFDGTVCNLSRYPNTDDTGQWPKCWFSTSDSRYKGTQQGYWSREDSGTPGTFFIVKYEDPVLDTWTHNTDQLLINAYLKYFWAPETIPVTIDKQNKFIRAKTHTVYGVEDGTGGRPFQVINVYEEIDQPGEWYVDTKNKKMYIYPTTNNPENFYITTLGDVTLNISDAENITIRGLNLIGGKSAGSVIANSKNVVLDQCEIAGMEYMGLRVDGSENCGIKNSHIHHIGAGGVSLREGGDIATMTKCNNFVTNCEINDFQLINVSYTPAVNIDNSVGCLVDHNDIHDSEHCAIRFEGPLNVMEYNKFYDVVKTATDMAAIYTGRNVRTVGNVIRYNYFRNVGGNSGDHGTQAIFYDDGTSGNEVYCNVFGERCGTFAAIKNYGGIDNHYYNNLFLNNPVCGYNAAFDSGTWVSQVLGAEMRVVLDDGTRIVDLENYQEKWPWMKKLSERTFTGTDYREMANLYENNLFFGIDTLLADNCIMARADTVTHPPARQKNNQVFNGNTAENKAYFVDYDKGDYTLTEEAYTKIRAKIPEFKEIPFLWMGREAIVNQKPFVENATLNGTLTLSVTYDYQDAERDLEGETKFTWLWSDSKDGKYTKIDGATSSLYQVEEKYIGKYVKAEITPVDEFGVAGTTVSTAAVFIVAGVDSLQALVDQIQEEIDNAKVGTDLGQYSADAIKEMKEAVKAAKAVLDGTDTDTSVVNAAKALDAAYETFKGQQKTDLNSDLAEGTITIPSDLRTFKLELGEVTGAITIDGAKTMPETTVKAIINGAEVIVKIPAGSKAGTIIEALNKPTAEVVGNHYVAAKIGVEGEAYKPEIEVTVKGGGELTLYSIEDGVATNMSGENADGDKVFTLSKGGEILLTRLKVADTDATLKSVTINGKKIGGFKPETINYILTYDQSVKEVIVEAEATSPDATVTIQQAETIPGKAIITVTAQDKSVEPKVYTFGFQYEKTTTETDTPEVTPPGVNIGGGTTISGVGGGIGGSSQSGNAETKSFVDIIGHWAEKDINKMAQEGIVSGVTDTTFEPDRSITRAEFAAIMVRALKLSAVNTKSVFKDVANDAWYADEVAAAAAAGLIVGYDGQFRPEDTITREEMAVIIMKAYVFAGKEVSNGSLDKFSDKEKISDWAEKYVDQAVSVGLISGMTNGTFAPKENATRAQVASITKRLMEK